MTDAKKDPLLEALLLIGKLKQCPISRNSLLSWLPHQGAAFSADLFIRGAEKMGLKACFRKRALVELTPELFPVVLLLQGNQTVIVTELDEDGNYRLIDPLNHEEKTVTGNDLRACYTEYCFIIKQVAEEASTQALLGSSEKVSHWFWQIFFRYRTNYSLIILVSLFVNLFAIAMPLFIMNVYDRVVPNHAVETLWVLTSGILLVIIFDFIMKAMRVYFVDLSAEKVDVLVSRKIFQQLLGLTMSERDASTGITAHRIQQFENIASFITSSTVITIVDLPFILLFLFIVYLVGDAMVLIPIVAMHLLILISLFIAIPLHRAVSESYKNGAFKQSILVESIKNFDMIKSLGVEGTLIGRWERYAALAAKAGVKSRYLQAIAANVATTIQLLTTVLVVVVGVYYIREGLLTMGALIACTILTTRALAPLTGLVNLSLRYQLAKLSLTSLSKLMSKSLENPTSKKTLSREKLEPRIAFHQVTFTYPGTTLPLFDRLSFAVQAGEKVGIIGPMGAGKSTILKLIMGFYSPEEGAILVGGVDIQQLDKADLRANISYSQQEDRLLRGTVRDNLVLRMPWAEDQKVIDAVRLAVANRFIDSHPQGYDLLVGEDGSDLSGGQRQAIALARTFLGNAE